MKREHRPVAIEVPQQPFTRLLRSFWVQSVLAVAVGGVLYWWIAELAGGFTRGDADSTLYSSVMMAHGYWSCTYRAWPPSQPLSGPIYPLASALIQWITRAGFSFPLPSALVGHSCRNALTSYIAWSRNSGAYNAALRTGLVAWVALCVSGIALLRSSAVRTKRGIWLIPLTLAFTPPVVFCVQEFYHPQDMWALAMVFAATALWLRGRMLWVGIFLALAVMSQPYTFLAVVVLFAMSPWETRQKMTIGGVATAALTAIIMYATSGTRALSATLLGTGDTSIHFGTWMWELHVSSTLGIALSRFAPLVAAYAISRWCWRRRPDISHDPVVLLGLIATCLSLRLVFEENLWGYYCMATGATLVLRDIIAARASRETIYWLVLVLIIFGDAHWYPRPWGSWHTWIWQLLLAPSAFFVSLFSLRRTMRSDPTSSRERINVRL